MQYAISMRVLKHFWLKMPMDIAWPLFSCILFYETAAMLRIAN
jgi:hypothetical protein